MKKYILLTALIITGCLETRSNLKDNEEKQTVRKTLSTLQQSNADVNQKFQDIDEELRRLNGKLESTENKSGMYKDKLEKNELQSELRYKDLKEKIEAYKEDLTSLNNEVAELKSMVASLQDRGSSATSKHDKDKDKNNFLHSAEEKFAQKEFREAILEYERYRKANPKGKGMPMATFKIGQSFEALKLREDAMSFYEEVVQKHPKSKEASMAAARMKALKKK